MISLGSNALNLFSLIGGGGGHTPLEIYGVGMVLRLMQ